MEGGRRFEGPRFSIERPARNLREEIERMIDSAETEAQRELAEKLLFILSAKDRAQSMAHYIATADPKDIATYRSEKKLGIFLVCDVRAPRTHRIGDIVVNQGDSLLQLHVPPKQVKTVKFGDLADSFHLLSEYIDLHQLNPVLIYGVT